MTDPITHTEAESIMDATCSSLMEHFDAVQILVTWGDHKTTLDCAWGQGNWYARQGLTRTFIDRDVAQENAAAQNANRDVDDGDEWKEE